MDLRSQYSRKTLALWIVIVGISVSILCRAVARCRLLFGSNAPSTPRSVRTSQDSERKTPEERARKSRDGEQQARQILVVGASGSGTGGVGQYITEQQNHLDEDVSLYDVSSPKGSGHLWFVTAFLRAAADAARFVRLDRPDLVHVHSSHDFSFIRESYYVLFSRYLWQCPVVLHVHGSSFDEFVRTDSRLLARYQSLVFDAACKTIVLSSYWKDVLSRRTDPETIEVVPNAVDPSAYHPSADRSTPHVVFLSNLIERKGVAEFLEALRSISGTDVPPYRVTIAGKGPLADDVTEFASANPDVSYRGFVTEAEKRELLSSGTIYVLPSHAEGLPIAILEAMAGGNAIVSTTVGSIPETIGSENGCTVPPRDATALGDAIRSLLHEPERTARMGRTNRGLIEDRYSWDVVSKQLQEIYRSCLADARQ